MSAFVYEDDSGVLVGEDGNDALIIEIEVDFEEYSLDSSRVIYLYIFLGGGWEWGEGI
jgi:hypothetical protein